MEWIQPRPPVQRQQLARIYRPDEPPWLLNQRTEAIGMTMVGSDSPGSWTLYVARTTRWREAGINSGLTIPTIDIEITTGEFFASVDVLYPESTSSGTSTVELLRGFATHFVAKEAVCQVRYRPNDYSASPLGLLESDTLTAWIAPGFPVPSILLPDVINVVDAGAATFADAKPIPLFAQRIRARVRDGGGPTTLRFISTASVVFGADSVLVPADGADHEYLIPVACTHVLATSGDGGLVWCEWTCVQ